MRSADVLALSTRMFVTRTKRTLLTILGVGIGIGAVLFLVSLGYGIQNVVLSQITTADSLLSLDVAPGTSGLIALDQESVDRIAAMPDVTEIARMKRFTAQLGYDGLTSDSIVQAVDPGFFRLHGLVVTDGAALSEEQENEIVISSATAKLLNTNVDDILGKEITPTLFLTYTDADENEQVQVIELDHAYRVVGIVDDETVSFAYIPLGTLGFTPDAFDLVKAKTSREDVSNSVREEIIGQGFLVSALSDVIDQARQVFRVVQIVLGLFGLIALAVSAIGMFNTMTIALLERTNEIGIMRSVGVTRRDIRMLFLMESMLMGLLGGIGGVALGFAAGEIANLGLNVLATTLGGRSLDVFVQPVWFVVVIVAFSTLIGLLTGIFPAKRAADMDPLEALRYK